MATTTSNFIVKNGLTVGSTAVINSSGNWIGPTASLIGATGIQGATGPSGGYLTDGSYVVRGVKGPEVVSEDNNGIKNVAYGNMVGLLIEAIKEQQIQIEELKSIIYNKG